jgi:putative protein-disulfide isomerase
MTTLTYLFDPLCGWCYGATAALQRLAEQPGFTVELAPSGLFSGSGARPMDESFAAFAWGHDQRISQMTGQPFSEAYRQKVLGGHGRLLDSGPATLALTAVHQSEPAQERAALKAIQAARYVEGRDITDTAVLADILDGIGLGVAADAIRQPDETLKAANRHRVETTRAAMQRFGINGVPALLIGDGLRRRPVQAGALFGNIDTLVGALKAA